jgi:hypothetical protein
MPDFAQKHTQKHIPTDAAELARHLLQNDGQSAPGVVPQDVHSHVAGATENERLASSPLVAGKVAPKGGIAPPATTL